MRCTGFAYILYHIYFYISYKHEKEKLNKKKEKNKKMGKILLAVSNNAPKGMFCRLMQGRAIWATPGYGERKAEQMHFVLLLWNFWRETALRWAVPQMLEGSRHSQHSAFCRRNPQLLWCPAYRRSTLLQPLQLQIFLCQLPQRCPGEMVTASALRVGFQLSQQSSSALGQPSSLYTLRTLKAVQQKEHRNTLPLTAALLY